MDEIPPLLAVRNKDTGLVSGVKYHFNPDGTVNWRKMVKPEFLVVNEENFKRRGENPPESIEGVEDRDLIILLAGLKELARLRGFTAQIPSIHIASPEYAAVKQEITWMPHRDVGMEYQTSGGVAMATLKNTEGFTKCYLLEMAENRAFARCIRNYLGINIVSQEEISKDKDNELEATPKKPKNAADPYVGLQEQMDAKGITFEALKEKLVNSGKYPDAQNYNSIRDIPKFKVLPLKKKIETLENNNLRQG